MKNLALAFLGGIIGAILYGWLGWFIILLAVWIAGAAICLCLLNVDYDDCSEELAAAALFISITLWFIFIPIVFFADRAYFCEFFGIPYFEFRSPIIVKEETE